MRPSPSTSSQTGFVIPRERPVHFADAGWYGRVIAQNGPVTAGPLATTTKWVSRAGLGMTHVI